jgi:hypothetical protein
LTTKGKRTGLDMRWTTYETTTTETTTTDGVGPLTGGSCPQETQGKDEGASLK